MMSSMPEKKPERPKVTARWTIGDERVMIHFLLEEKRAGRGVAPQSGFTPPTWATCAALLTGKEITGTVPKEAMHCHQKYNKLKANYKTVKELKKIPGMGWDAIRSVLVGSAEVWSTIDPKLSKWSKKAFPFYKEMGVLCDEHVANGSTQIMRIHPVQPMQEAKPTSALSGAVANDEWVPSLMQESSDEDELKKDLEPIGSPVPARLIPSTSSATSRSPPSPSASGSRSKKRKSDSEHSFGAVHDRLEHLTDLVSAISSAPTHQRQPSQTQGISPIVREAMTRVEEQTGWPNEFKVQCLTLFLLFPDTASGFMAIKSDVLAHGVLKSMINFKLLK